MTKLLFSDYIEKQLKRATYEYDKRVNAWAAWIEGVPGVYAQAPTVEAVREDLASALEEATLLAVRDKRRIPGFPFPKLFHAKAA